MQLVIGVFSVLKRHSLQVGSRNVLGGYSRCLRTHSVCCKFLFNYTPFNFCFSFFSLVGREYEEILRSLNQILCKHVEVLVVVGLFLEITLQVQACGSVVTEEQPYAMLIPIEYFLMGYGLYRPSQVRSPLSPSCISPELLSPESMGVKLKPIKTRISLHV
ncbi:hypothetical protein GW17_00017746 [Ensete ventricosum]|nr:hypothetical protein GW17_00017746 [Ensete ventricosum]RZS01262.1 hypothetical protein BHM03_00031075 [Ensete ventricosum]